MKLKTLHVENFRKFPELTLEFADRITTIAWPNKAGKTTIADAISWVLTGFMYSGASNDISLKNPADPRAKVLVELALETGWAPDKPQEIKLRREYFETWVRSAGATEARFTGHTSNYFINDVKVLAGEYDKRVREIFNIKSKKHLAAATNVYYFAQTLTYQERREMLDELIGIITPEEIVDAMPVLAAIRPKLRENGDDIVMTRRSIDGTLKGPNGLNKTRDDLESMIKGATISNPVSKEDAVKAANIINANSEQEVGLKVKAAGLKNPFITDLENKINADNALLAQSTQADTVELGKLNRAVNEKIDAKRQALQDLNNKRRTVLDKISQNKTDVAGLTNKINAKTDILAGKKTRLQDLDRQFDEIAGEDLPDETIGVRCPKCAHEFEIKTNASEQELFTASQAARIDRINADGQTITAEINTLENDIAELKARKADLETNAWPKLQQELADIDTDVDKTAKELEAARNETVLMYSSQTTVDIRTRLDANRKAMADERAKPTASGIDEQVKQLQDESAKNRIVVNQYNAEEVLRKRASEWETKLKTIRENVATAENQLSLLRAYAKTRLEIMRSRLQAFFPGLEFQLVRENLTDDSYDEVCFVLDRTPAGPIPYETTNTERKIKLGLQIIDALGKGLHIEPLPVVVDNAEAITDSNRNFETDLQLILMVAQDPTPESR